MAVQKKRSTRSKRGKRRLHDKIKKQEISINEISNEIHFRHHLTKSGYYRGYKLFNK